MLAPATFGLEPEHQQAAELQHEDRDEQQESSALPALSLIRLLTMLRAP